jgi:sec-independent protein translocase protein TatB
MSFGEMVVLGVVALVVVGPRNLPTLLRSAGQLIGKVRRMANELRVESGIDEILDAEGIRSEIDNFKRLASGAISPDDLSPNVVPDREREYPRVGADAYGAFSEDLVPYLPAELPSLAGGGGGGENGGGTTPGASVAPADTHPISPTSPPAPVTALSGPTPTPTTASPSTNGAGIKS